MTRERIIAAIVAIMLVTGSLIMGACGAKDSSESKADSSSSSKVEETTTAPVTTEALTAAQNTTEETVTIPGVTGEIEYNTKVETYTYGVGQNQPYTMSDFPNPNSPNTPKNPSQR